MSLNLRLRIGRLHPAKQRLIAWAVAFALLRWVVLVGVGLAYGANWPDETVNMRTGERISAAESWQNLVTICGVVALLDVMSFLMIARSRVLTALGIALVFGNTVWLAVWLYSTAGVLWPEAAALSFWGRTALRAWLWLAIGTGVVALLGSADPERIPPGRTIAKRVAIWSLALAAIVASIWLASRRPW